MTDQYPTDVTPDEEAAQYDDSGAHDIKPDYPLGEDSDAAEAMHDAQSNDPVSAPDDPADGGYKTTDDAWVTPTGPMQGKRRPDGTRAHELAPGEYSLEGDCVWLCLPSGEVGHVVRPTWTITVEDDDTITVSPSIFANARGNPPGWHGYLERGVWRSC